MQENFLKRALTLAQQRRGFCAPNPSVGAVLVKDGQIISEGFHESAGKNHAEVVVLNQTTNAKISTLFLTLEPCGHHGRTPPCTDKIIESGVSKVVYAFSDPNPLVSGLGTGKLRAAGIECEQLALPEIDNFYQSYVHWTENKTPWVTAKLATSLDGKIAGPNGERINITEKEANQFTHENRLKSDAILTTAKTIAADDPLLNARNTANTVKKPLYILDSNLKTPLNAKIFESCKKVTIFYYHLDAYRLDALQKRGAACISVVNDETGLDLTQVLNKIGEDGIHDLWVEAGGACFNAFARQGLLNKAFICIAPKTLGSDALGGFLGTNNVFDAIKSVSWSTLGPDVICELGW